MNDDYGIVGNSDLIPFYQRPEIVEKMRRIYDPSKIHPTATTRARTSRKAITNKTSPIHFTTFHW